MAEVTKNTNSSLNLLGSLTRVEVPFVKVTIGDPSNGYTFGVYDKVTTETNSYNESIKTANVKYPNYIQSLSITKINGQVNQYTLSISYPITVNNDPNFFEKIFSSVSDSRKIIFSYGDLSMPTFIYRDEEAIITTIDTQFKASSSVINYTIHAVSSATLLTAGTFSFPQRYQKPSTVIYELLQNKSYGLQEIFYGMRDVGKLEMNNVIARDDAIVNIEAKPNISILDYLTYLVSCMVPESDKGNSLTKSGIYVLNVIDDTSGTYAGPYFTVKKLTANQQGTGLDTYTIDMGYPSQNIVTDFSVENNETYSIFYKYTNTINQEEYQYRINDKGKMEPVYAPLLSSGNTKFKTNESDRTWWSSVTQYPVSATLTMKGLLRPAILMSYVKLNMYYYGKKHISSGLYVITKQVDTIAGNGFKTTLSLVRVSGDTDYDGVIGSGYDGRSDKYILPNMGAR